MCRKQRRAARQSCRYRIWLVVILTVFIPSILLPGGSPGLELSNEEISWLRENSDKLLLYYTEDFPPAGYRSETGDFAGLGADVLSLIEKELGVSFKKTPFQNWNAQLDALRTGRSAIAPTIVETEERRQYIFFTDPFAVVPVVIITSKNTKGTVSFQSLAGKKVCAVSGSAPEKLLQGESLLYGIEIVQVESVQQGLESVAFGEASAFVESLAVASYMIERLGYSNLRVGGETNYRFEWKLGVSKEYPLLFSAIQKALRHIPESELETIRNRWISFGRNGGLDPTLRLWIGFSIGFLIILAISLSVLSFLLKRRLTQKVADLRKSEEKYRQTADNSPAVVYQLRLDPEGYASFLLNMCVVITKTK